MPTALRSAFLCFPAVRLYYLPRLLLRLLLLLPVLLPRLLFPEFLPELLLLLSLLRTDLSLRPDEPRPLTAGWLRELLYRSSRLSRIGTCDRLDL